MSSQTKIAVYSVADLKNTTEDALPVYLNSLKFRQSHHYTDVRLALGYSAVIIAGVLFYYDWTLGWNQTKAYTGPAVVIYFILNAAFTYWIWGVEKGNIFVGEGTSGKVEISSRTDKYSPQYNLDVRYTTSKSAKQWHTKSISAPFSRWFTSDGYFVAKPFQQWLASQIPPVGEADPGNVVEEIGRGSGPSRQPADADPQLISQAKSTSNSSSRLRKKN